MNLGRYDLEMIDASHELLKIIMLRRTKGEVELSVPPKEEITVFLPLR